ncbi:MAG TPA: signal recognition particle protein, partial [Microbacterium sp.]|nr:signal recognition particle protein [Microbacterium sp.]
GGVPQIPGMGPMPGSHGGGKRSKQAPKQAGSRSGNPAKRAAENAGLAAAPVAPTGSGFGLGAKGAGAPSEADLAEIQKLFGKG